MPTVLFVDDSKSVRHVFGIELAKEGYNVVLAADGDEALAIVDTQTVDLVILDVHMRRLGGVATMARLRAMRPTLPIVLHSGYRESDILGHTRLKPDAYVSKTGHSRELKRAVSRLLVQRGDAGSAASPAKVLRVDEAELAPPKHWLLGRGRGDKGAAD